MPIYIFWCERENKKKELYLQKAEPKAICPDCEKEGEIIQLKLHKDSYLTTPPPFGIYCQKRINRGD